MAVMIKLMIYITTTFIKFGIEETAYDASQNGNKHLTQRAVAGKQFDEGTR